MNVRVVPQVRTNQGMSADQLRNLSAAMLGTAEPPVIPGMQAVKQALNVYNPSPAEVPPLQAPGMAGVVEAPPITAESPVSDLAEATQSPYASRTRYEPVVDENGQPQVDESGQYVTRPIPMEKYGEEQATQLASVPNMAGALEEQNPVDVARSILGLKNEASEGSAAGSVRAIETGKVDSSTLNKWADTSAPALGIVTDSTLADLFSNDAVIGSTDAGFEGVPIGFKVMNDYGVPFELAKPLSTVFGVAHALATEQTQLYKDNPTPVLDKNNKPIDDAVPEVDVINSVINSAQNALQKLGYNIAPEAVRKLAEAKVKSEIYQGRHRPMLDKNNRWVLASSDSMKDLSRKLSYLSAALAGDERRVLPSKVPQVSGSNFLKPGSQTTRNSLSIPGIVASAAEAAKDILGSIAEQFNPKSVLSTTLQLQDIEANMVNDDFGKPIYSTSVFAKRHKVSQDDYNKLKEKTKPEDNYNANDPRSVANFQNKQENHAREEIQNKIQALKYDIMNAQAIKGMAYTGYIHSSANQRFFRANAGTDILSSKSGTREMLNFGLQSLVRPEDIMNPASIQSLKSRANSIFKLKGKQRADALMKLRPSDRTALGLMECAVVNFYSFSGDPSIHNASVKKLSEAELINMYTPDIGKHMAILGEEYNNWLKDPQNSTLSILKLLAKMPRGEAQANQNMWDDFYNLDQAFKNPATKQGHVRLTALNYDDGNQNGIFIQSLYAGKPEIATRLGSYNASLADMRGYALNLLGDNINEVLKGKEEKAEAWKDFFKEIVEANPDGIASDLFKAPLMQNAYGKDASMFTEHVIEFLQDSSEYQEAARKNLLGDGLYPNMIEAATDLSLAMEQTLRQVIDPKFTSVLKRLGRMFAILNTVPTIKGVAGDDLVFSSVDVGFVPDFSKDIVYQDRTPEGEEYSVKKKGISTTSYMTPEGVVEAPEARRRLNPSATKGTQLFYNKRTNQFDSFENPLGSALARLLGVMPIQSTDGDLLKLMLLDVNADKKIPLPVATVHDSLITTMDTMHIYRNSYNNVAIPQAVAEVKKFASKLATAYNEAKHELFTRIDGEKYIGIGANGDFPSMGALFDELSNKINSPQYKEIFMRRSNNSDLSWKNFVESSNEVLKEARKNGWKPELPDLAIDSKQFKALFELAESTQQIGGANNKFKQWVNNFEANVEAGFKQLKQNQRVKEHGIAQMTHA